MDPARIPQNHVPPPRWGEDSLSDFLETAYQNRWATFHNKKSSFAKLSGIDECFMRIAKDWLNPKNILTPHFLIRSHAAFRAACEHSMAGQIADSFPQQRACLEYAAYALHIDKNEGLAEIWLQRHDSKSAFDSVIREFKPWKIQETLKNSNRHIAKIFEHLYQQSIDFGAHPNERAISGSLSITDYEGGKRFQQTYLHDDDLSLSHGVTMTARVGICALEILQCAFQARFELLGVRSEILELRKGL